jgi:hypothetical protein
MSKANVSHPGEDLNVPAVSLESEAWLLAQTSTIDRPSFAVGAVVALTHTIRYEDVYLRRGTRGVVKGAKFETDGMVWTFTVAWDGLSLEVFEHEERGPVPDDKEGRLREIIRSLYGSGKVVGHTSEYIVEEQEIRPAGEVRQRIRRKRAA